MQNRRFERDGVKGKCLSVLSVVLILFLLSQLHFTNFENEDPPIEEAAKPNLNVLEQFHPVKPEKFDFNIPDQFTQIKAPIDSFVMEWNEFHKQTDGYVEPIADIRRCEIEGSRDVNSPGDKYINLGMTIINIDQNKPRLNSDFKWKLTRTLESIFQYSSGTPLHFVLITDQHTVKTVAKFFAHFISKKVAMNAIQDQHWRWRKFRGFPKVKISFVDIQNIISLSPAFINALRKNTASKDPIKDKYVNDLFYIAPMYHGAFMKLKKLIFLDSTDLEFFNDILLLEDQFDSMENKLIGVGLDLSPHYRRFLGDYLKEHPDTPLGLPGKKQGFNTGVVLFNLDKMRYSKLYNSYMTPKMVDVLSKKYKYKMSLGDQDWFTNMGFEHPDLFYVLPCRFNTQTSIQYLRPPWEEQFEEYHFCDKKSRVVVFHRNGCGPTPEHCGFKPEPDNEYWMKHSSSHIADVNIDVELFFKYMSNKNKYMTRSKANKISSALP